MNLFGYTLPEIRKALTAAAGILTTLLAADLLPAGWGHAVSTAAGVLTVVATYAVPNGAPAPRGAHEAP